MKSVEKALELAKKNAKRLNKVHCVMRTNKGDIAVEREEILSTAFGKGLYPSKEQLIHRVEPESK